MPDSSLILAQVRETGAKYRAEKAAIAKELADIHYQQAQLAKHEVMLKKEFSGVDYKEKANAKVERTLVEQAKRVRNVSKEEKQRKVRIMMLLCRYIIDFE